MRAPSSRVLQGSPSIKGDEVIVYMGYSDHVMRERGDMRAGTKELWRISNGTLSRIEGTG